MTLACFALFLRSPKTHSLRRSDGGHRARPRPRPPPLDRRTANPVVLPFTVFAHLPVLKGFAAVRFSLYTSLFGAVIFTIGLDELRQRLPTASAPSSGSIWWRLTTAGVLAAIGRSRHPAVGAESYSAGGFDQHSSFFTSSAIDAIPEGSVLFAYPYPDVKGPDIFFEPPHNIMLDQAASGMRFKLVGGYGWFPSATGSAGTATPQFSGPVRSKRCSTMRTMEPRQRVPSSREDPAISDLRSLLRRYDVETVVWGHWRWESCRRADGQ